MDAVLKVTGLTKTFGGKAAVNNISFEINKGQVFGLLGPNGSGKTTTLSMILTLLQPSSGDIHLFGSTDLTTGLKRTGVLMESANYYPELSARNNMLISCKIKNVDSNKINGALQQVDLTADASKKVKKFSLGMKQRLSLASALLNEPELLIFDEPTNGLDPMGIADTREIIKELAQKGKTILIASHLLNEMEKVCTHIALLKNGSIIDQGELQLLTTGYDSLEDYFMQKKQHENMRALQIEFIKLLRPSTYILLGILLAIMLAGALLTFLNVTATESMSSLMIKTTDNSLVGIIFPLFCIFIILNIGKEFSENTLRRSIIEGYTRNEFFTGKLLLVLVVTIFLFVLQKVVFLAAAASGGHYKEALTYITPWVIISGLLKVLFYGLFGFFLIFVTRSIAISIALYFIWGLIEAIIKGLLLFKFPDMDWNNYLPVSSMERVLNGTEIVALQFILIPFAYQLIMLGSSYWLLLKRDIK